MIMDMFLIELTFLCFSCRSDGKDEKSEGEGKDGKGETCELTQFLIYIYKHK